MNAETLRNAAEVLRERATAATVAPWEASPVDGLVWADRLGDPVSGSTLSEDATYIATVHPGVGLALADWLDYFGDLLAKAEELDMVEERPFRDSLAVARLILGGAS